MVGKRLNNTQNLNDKDIERIKMSVVFLKKCVNTLYDNDRLSFEEFMGMSEQIAVVQTLATPREQWDEIFSLIYKQTYEEVHNNEF